MNTYWTILNTIVAVFSIIGLGAVMRRSGWLTQPADESLTRIMLNVLFPCLMLDAILGNRALERIGNLGIAPLVGFGTLVSGYIIGRFAAPLVVSSATERRSFAFTVGTYNYAYLPVPLTLLIFDRETLGVLFLHNVGVDIGFWTIGLVILTGRSIKGGWRGLLNMPLLAIVVALLLNFSGVKPWIPGFVTTVMRMLGQCAIPITLLVIGATIVDNLSELRGRGGVPTIIGACLLRLVVLPIGFLALAYWLPCSLELKRVIAIQAAMPSASLPIVLAKRHGGDVPTALRVALGTSVVSLVTTPLWLNMGVRWLH